MRAVLPKALGSAVALLAVGGCGVLIGLGDLERVPGLGEPEAGAEAGEEAGPEAAPACTKTSDQEVCDDGIDNDCNGTTDCDDPACAASFQCVPAPPAGWRPISFSPDARPTCPARSQSSDLEAQGPNPTSACTCTCGGGTCTGATSLFLGTSPNGCPDAATATSPLSAACTSLGSPALDFESYRIGGGTPAGPCTATTTQYSPPTRGRSCAGQVAARCGAGGTCAPRPSAGLTICIEHDGAEPSCPAGYSRRYVVGDAIADGRSCSGCVCGSPSCTVEVQIWETAANCGGAPEITQQSDATCRNRAGGKARSFSSRLLDAGCAVATQPTLRGSRTVTRERTVCCP